jgi:predicted nucleic acid-binding protein
LTGWNIKKPSAVNGIDFFVDTNILIYMLEKRPAVFSFTRFSLAVSVITEIELLGKKNITEHEINKIRNLLNNCEIIDINNTIKEIAISLKQKYTVKIPDALIVATAKSFGLPLITADVDLYKIKEGDIVILELQTT